MIHDHFSMQSVTIKNHLIGIDSPLAFFCGPCVIEDESFAMRAAEELKNLFSRFPFSFIFKASYDKANRSSVHSFRGPGLDEGLKILQKIQKEFDLPVITDVHSPEEATLAGAICDAIQ